MWQRLIKAKRDILHKIFWSSQKNRCYRIKSKLKFFTNMCVFFCTCTGFFFHILGPQDFSKFLLCCWKKSFRHFYATSTSFDSHQSLSRQQPAVIEHHGNTLIADVTLRVCLYGVATAGSSLLSHFSPYFRFCFCSSPSNLSSWITPALKEVDGIACMRCLRLRFSEFRCTAPCNQVHVSKKSFRALRANLRLSKRMVTCKDSIAEFRTCVDLASIGQTFLYHLLSIRLNARKPHDKRVLTL